MSDAMTDELLDKATGCLLGGACGDALGAPVEFHSAREIEAEYGPSGIADFAPAYGRVGAITDDTQMTLFTAEGLTGAFREHGAPDAGQITEAVHAALLRWLMTQTGRPGNAAADGLLAVPGLWAQRAPGNTCLSALAAARVGRPAINDSKGCGAVMRMAPVGFLVVAGWNIESVFELGRRLGHLTHAHPSGYLSSGGIAAIIGLVLEGASLPDAVERTLAILEDYPDHEETSAILRRTLRFGSEGDGNIAAVGPGGGWVGEEALAIAVCACLRYPAADSAIVAAVNHDGDSDSTGAIAGNIAGALHGTAALPERWLDVLELRPLVESVAADLLKALRQQDPEARAM